MTRRRWRGADEVARCLWPRRQL